MSFADYLRSANPQLLEGALLIAADAHPNAQPDRVRGELTSIANALRPDFTPISSAADAASKLARGIYELAGFSGNSDDYYDPENSYIDSVLERRTGIPISLALVYTEVARQLDVEAHGVSFPGHFLVRIDLPSQDVVFVDPFFGGNTVGEDGLEALMVRAGLPPKVDPQLLEPATVKQTLIRMLSNLRAAHTRRADFRKLLVVLDRMIELNPAGAAEHRDRGLLYAKLGAPEAAVADLERYTSLSPGAGDVAEVRRYVDVLKAKQRMVN